MPHQLEDLMSVLADCSELLDRQMDPEEYWPDPTLKIAGLYYECQRVMRNLERIKTDE